MVQLTPETQSMLHLFEIPLRAELSKQLKKLSDADVFIDVGACVGTSCLLLKHGTCFAFEFDPDAVKELKRNLALNPNKKIEIVESAVSNDEVGYELKRKGRLGDTYLVKNPQVQFPKTVTLDNFFKHTANIKLLKIDAEGEDYNVLLGAKQLLRKHHPWVIAEAWNNEIESSIVNFLQGLGYSTRKIGINVVGEYQHNKRRLEVTTMIGCSVNCHYCPQEVLLKAYQGPKVLTLTTFQSILNNTPKNVTIEFAGFSEPFLNSECLSMIEYAIGNGFHIIVDTTLTGLTSSGIERLAKLDFEAFSLHLPDNRQNTCIPADSSNYRDVLINCLTSLRVNSFMAMNDDFASNTRAGNCKGEPCRNLKGMFNCYKLNSNPSPVVLPNGDVYLCCMDYGLKHKLGNLLTSTYESILNSTEYRKIQKNQSRRIGLILCRHCLFAIPFYRYHARIVLSRLVWLGNNVSHITNIAQHQVKLAVRKVLGK